MTKVVFGRREPEIIRIISLRKATRGECKNYEEAIRDGLETNLMQCETKISTCTIPPELGPEFFANAILWPGTKQRITLRLDPDVLKFFRKQGRGYQTTINAVLRKYVEAQSRGER